MEKKRGRKPKFRPVIKRVRLDHEQAVLTCNCYLNGYRDGIEAEPAYMAFARTSGWCYSGKSFYNEAGTRFEVGVCLTPKTIFTQATAFSSAASS